MNYCASVIANIKYPYFHGIPFVCFIVISIYRKISNRYSEDLLNSALTNNAVYSLVQLSALFSHHSHSFLSAVFQPSAIAILL